MSARGCSRTGYLLLYYNIGMNIEGGPQKNSALADLGTEPSTVEVPGSILQLSDSPEEAGYDSVTKRQLGQNTSGVIMRVAETGRPAFVTHRGRVTAVILPMTEAAVAAQGRVLGAIANEVLGIQSPPQ